MPDEIAARLNYVARQEQLQLQPDAAELLARLANGGMRDALTLLDQCSGAEVITQETVLSAMGLAGTLRTASLLRAAASGDTAGALSQFKSLWQDGKDPAALLDELAGLMRDALMRAVAPKGGDALLSGAYDTATLDGFAAQLGAGRLLSGITTIQDTLSGLAQSTDTRLAAELCIIRLSRPQMQEGLSALAARVTALENGAAPKAAPIPAEPLPEPVSAPKPEKKPEPRPEPKPEPRPEPKPEPIPEPAPTPEEPPFDTDRPPLPEEPPVRPEPVFDQPVPEPAAPMQPDPVPEAPTQPAPAPEAPRDDMLWERVCAALRGQLQIADFMLLQDPLQVSPSFDGDTLRIRLDKSFAAGQFNKPSVAELIRDAAAQCAGRPIRVEMTEMDAREQINQRSIDELARFGNVTIT